jgi:hypothetical protein
MTPPGVKKRGIPLSQKGQPLGVATLDASGYLDISQIPPSVADAMTMKGGWDATGGTYPTSPSNGDTYKITVAGVLPLGQVQIGDSIIYKTETPAGWFALEMNIDIGPLTGEVPQNGADLGASQIVETNGSNKLITAPKNTGYNKALGTSAGNVAEGNHGHLVENLTTTENDNSKELKPNGSGGLVWSDNVIKEPNGFPNRTDSNISFTDGSLTFTIAPAVSSFDVYVQGKKFTKSSSENKVISDTEGLHYIYYDAAGVLQETLSWSRALYIDYAFVAVVYWDVSGATHLLLGDERHGVNMDGESLVEFHITRGTYYISGLSLNGFVIGDGSLVTHAQFGIEAGSYGDEDIIFASGAKTAPAQIPVFYKSGSGGDWNKDTATNFPVKPSGGTRLAYNQFTGGSWTQTEVQEGYFVLTHILATNDPNTPYIAVQGEDEYATLDEAEKVITEFLSVVLGGLPSPELKSVGTVIFQTSSGYGNTIKAKIVALSNGDNFFDLRCYSERATMCAANIRIEDAAGRFDADTVEGALAEIQFDEYALAFFPFHESAPNQVHSFYGKDAAGYLPPVNIRLRELKLQLESTNATNSDVRATVYKWDAGTASAKEILNIQQSALSVGWHDFTDNTPDQAEWEVDVAAGDRVFILLSDIAQTGSAASVKNVSGQAHYERV